jgi:hypothetical protein
VTQRYFWIGDQGPYIYDDTKAIEDPDGIFSGSPPNQRPMIVAEVPDEQSQVVRLEDLTSGLASNLPVNKTRVVEVAQTSAISETTLFENDCASDYVTGVQISVYMLCNRGMGDNLLSNYSFETGDPPDDWSHRSAGGVRERSSDFAVGGTYSVKCTNLANEFYYLYRNLASPEDYSEKTVTFKCRAKTSTAEKTRIRISGTGINVYSAFHTGSGDWELLTATGTVGASCAILQVLLYHSTTVTVDTFDVYFDSAHFYSPELVATDYVPESDNLVTLNVHWDDSVNLLTRQTKLDINRTGAVSKEQYFIALKPNTEVTYETTVPATITNDAQYFFILIATEL